MIVRINQIDVSRLDSDGGWPGSGTTSGFAADWPSDVRAFELLILSQDEKNQPLTDDFRQHQLRQMIPQAAIALTSIDAPTSEPSTPMLLRLDGGIAPGELLAAWQHLFDANGQGRFAFSSSARINDPAAPVSGSVRITPTWQQLASVCNDPAIGLERSVRLRLLGVPSLFLSEGLIADEPNDVRWTHLLSECPLYVGTTSGLRSLHIVVRQMDATQVKSRVMQRLMAVARGEPAIP